MLALFPVLALAELRSASEVLVGSDEVIQENLTVFSREVLIQGTVEGDLVAFAENVRIVGTVKGDVLGAARRVTVEGSVGGSVRVAGAEVRLAGPIGGDAMAAGANVTIAGGSSVAGEAMIAGKALRVDGLLGGDLHAAGSSLDLNAPVNGNVRAEVGTLELLPGAAITGNLVYRSEDSAKVASGVRVGGAVERLEGRPERGGIVPMLFFALRAFVGLFALGLVFVLLFPRFARQAPTALVARPWRSLGFGAAALFGIPLFATLLFVVGAILGGWWLGLVVLALYAVAIALSLPIAGMAFGEWVFQRVRGKHVPLIAALAVGLLCLVVLGAVPVLNAIVFIAAVLFGLGALTTAAVQNRRGRAIPA